MNDATPRQVRAPTGTRLSAKSWLTEAPLRMLMNNLDPEVAERPEDLVVYGGTDGHPFAVIFKPDPDEAVALVDDPRIYSPPYFGPSGWLALDLTAAPVDLGEVAELADSSYRQVALKRMLRALDDRASSDR